MNDEQRPGWDKSFSSTYNNKSTYTNICNYKRLFSLIPCLYNPKGCKEHRT